MTDFTPTSEPTSDAKPSPTTPVATTAADFQAGPSTPVATAIPEPEAETEAEADAQAEAAAATPPATPLAASVGERVLFGLRQWALIAMALVIAGLVTERMRPTDVIDRGIASTPFLWAAVLWLGVLAFHAIAFDRSQMSTLERGPLFGALVVSAFVLLTGLISLETISTGRRLVYLIANSLGSVMFWWALFSLVALVVSRIAGESAAT